MSNDSVSTIPKHGPARLLWEADDFDEARELAADRGGDRGGS